MRFAVMAWTLLFTSILSGQVIEFESGGLKYQTLTKDGVTIMFAHLPEHVREYTVLQIAISNGSNKPWVVKPEDFTWTREDGTQLHPMSARAVVEELLAKGGRSDVIKLVSAYETGLYGMKNLRSTNGYETRRRAVLAEVQSTKLKAAAAASAIAFVNTKLAAGETTDGALFMPTNGKSLGAGQLRALAAGKLFEFDRAE
jgi:hypothetical protein